jgi:hypothetical protein
MQKTIKPIVLSLVLSILSWGKMILVSYHLPLGISTIIVLFLGWYFVKGSLPWQFSISIFIGSIIFTVSDIIWLVSNQIVFWYISQLVLIIIFSSLVIYGLFFDRKKEERYQILFYKLLDL